MVALYSNVKNVWTLVTDYTCGFVNSSGTFGFNDATCNMTLADAKTCDLKYAGNTLIEKKHLFLSVFDLCVKNSKMFNYNFIGCKDVSSTTTTATPGM